ncbi:MAG: nucleoside recognition protein [Thermodesulfobacteriota bacterium]
MKKTNKAASGKRSLFLSLAASFLVVCAGLLWPGSSITWGQVPKGLAFPLLRLMLVLAAGLAAAQALEAAGWTRHLGRLAGPLFRFAHLPPHASAAFSTAFFSGAASNAMLLEFYQTGKITKKQLILSNLINQLPAYFLHLPTVFFVVVPLTRTAGLIYMGLTFVAAILRTALFALWGRLHIPASDLQRAEEAPVAPERRRRSKGDILLEVKKRLPRRVLEVAVWVVPIYAGVFVFNRLGGFDWTQDWMARTVTLRIVPMESVSVVMLSFAAEFSSGFAAAGALMSAGVLSVKQAVLALIIGNITAFPVRALRHQLPRYMGVFSPGLGAQILLLGQGFRIASLIFTGMVFYWAA